MSMTADFEIRVQMILNGFASSTAPSAKFTIGDTDTFVYCPMSITREQFTRIVLRQFRVLLDEKLRA